MKPIQTQCRQTGMTIIEMLVALVILSIGMLGIAALQARGQQYNTSAHIRTQATILATELIERIRVNSDPDGDGVSDDYAVTIPATAPSPDCDVAVCSPVQLRNYDLFNWQARIRVMFPSGTGNIAYNTASINGARNYVNTPVQNRDRYQISITWNLSDTEKDDLSVANEIKTMTWVVAP